MATLYVQRCNFPFVLKPTKEQNQLWWDKEKEEEKREEMMRWYDPEGSVGLVKKLCFHIGQLLSVRSTAVRWISCLHWPCEYQLTRVQWAELSCVHHQAERGFAICFHLAQRSTVPVLHDAYSSHDRPIMLYFLNIYDKESLENALKFVAVTLKNRKKSKE